MNDRSNVAATKLKPSEKVRNVKGTPKEKSFREQRTVVEAQLPECERSVKDGRIKSL